MTILDKCSQQLKDDNETIRITPDHVNAWHENPVTKKLLNDLNLIYLDMLDAGNDPYVVALGNVIEQVETYRKEEAQ